MAEYKKTGIKNWAVEDRPREKMLSKGTGSLSDSELLAILIGSGTKNDSAVDLARKLLHEAGNNLNRLGKYGINDMKRIKGIGKARAVSIMAALELGRRRKYTDIEETEKITSSTDVFQYMYSKLSDLSYEEFWVLFLNRSNKIIEKRRISQGGISGTVTDVRLILKSAIENLASSIIICHNHPSGNLHPSDSDIKITQKIKDSAILMDITLLDHVIVAGNNFYSFADDNKL